MIARGRDHDRSATGGALQRALKRGVEAEHCHLADPRADDDASALSPLRRAERELTGKESNGQAWEPLFDLLATELKIAATRTTVSSVPAFLTEHLRRRLWKVDQKRASEIAATPEQGSAPALSDEEKRKCPDCAGTNFWYPDGQEKGVAKCKHARLTEEKRLDLPKVTAPNPKRTDC